MHLHAAGVRDLNERLHGKSGERNGTAPMPVALSILSAIVAAALGAVLSQNLDDEPLKLKRVALAFRGGIVGAAWGGLAGFYLGRIITVEMLIDAAALALWPVVIFAALALVGILARRRAAHQNAGGANSLGALSAALGFIVLTFAFVCLVIVFPNTVGTDVSFEKLPASEHVDVAITYGSAAMGGVLGSFLLMLVSNEFATAVVGGSLGLFLGGLAGSLFISHGDVSTALGAAIAAVAGGLCISFAWGLAGCIIGAAIGSLFLIVWILVPGIGKASSVLPDKDEYTSDLVEMRGVEFVKAFGNFGILASEQGPFSVIAMIMAMLAFVGAIFGFLFGPAFGDGVMHALGVAFP